MRSLTIVASSWVSVAFWVLGTQARADQPSGSDFFEQEIRPVLLEKCQKCHGPIKQESGLRVDSREALLKGGESGPAVVPGQPGEGTLLKALSHQHDVKMPPSGKLPPSTLVAMRQWVEKGAPWASNSSSAAPTRTSAIILSDRKHWAFQPIRVTEPARTGRTSWGNTEIDHWIAAGWKAKTLKPVKPASKRTLIRRATLDLTGLPPTPEEIESFLVDSRPDAFAHLVERLLASPAYGERWGRHWLDVARYADTAGDGADYPVPEAWRYRNWVIDAFQSDMPFNEFIKQQIAGDILANQNPNQDYASRVIATGFLSLGKRYGYNPGPDFQHLDLADVIESVGRSILGLSLGCARCHDHKYEPVSMEDYYALYGIFQSTKWAFPGGEEHKKPANLVPLVPPATARDLEKKKEKEVEALATKLRLLKREKGQRDGTFRAGGKDLDWEGQTPGKPPTTPWLSMGPNTILAEAQSPYLHIHPKGTRGIRMSAGQANDGIRYVFPDPFLARASRFLHFTIDFRNLPGPGEGSYRLYLGRGVIASTALDISISPREIAVGSGQDWETVASVETNTWHTLQIRMDTEKKTFSGFLARANQPRLTFGERKLAPGWDGVLDTFICDGLGHKKGPFPVHDLDNIGISEEPFSGPGETVVQVITPGPEEKSRIQVLEAEIRSLEARSVQLQNQTTFPVAYAVSEGQAADAKIQKRGEPDKPGALVPRRFLEILGGAPLKDRQSSGRLELAHWLVQPDNPLTARVFVNRVWQWHFGKGLVPTASDFGLRGDPPTHPELLDLLASRFIESGWSVKTLHRMIMNSHTYQLSSEDNQENALRDPENTFLWRFSRRPLEAEVVRDCLLFVSGKLNRKRPEGHPFPPVSSWGYTIHNPFHAVYDSDHRSVYLMIQRNRRHPFLSLFDGADPNLSVAMRTPTTTPVQALYLLNSPLVHEQSLGLASRLLDRDIKDRNRVGFLAEITQARSCEEAEIQEATAFVQEYSQALISSGQTPQAAQKNAWAALARVYLTANAFLHLE